MHSSDFIIIAHRGESYEAPENTLASINLAWERGADAVEIDVHLSKDNVIVVIHDNNTFRTGNKDKNVREQTLEELRRLDVGIYKGKKWKNERIPTISQVIDTIPEGKKLFVEIKCGKEIIPLLKNIVSERSSMYKRMIFIGLDLPTMQAIKGVFSQHNVLWVCSKIRGPDNRCLPDVDILIENAANAGLDGLDVCVCDDVDFEFVQKVKRAGLKLFVWTVDEIEVAKGLINSGVNGITSNRSSWLKNQLKR